jgi:hypothetical protein
VPSYYQWLVKNTNYIKNIDALQNVYTMFRNQNIVYDYPKEQKKENKTKLIELLEGDGFIF